MLTRAGVAKRLGRSLATVRRMEGTELHPSVDDRGVHRFDPDEVDAFTARGSDQPAQAPVFEHDQSPREAAIALQAANARISELKQRCDAFEADAQRLAILAERAQHRACELRGTAVEALDLVETLLGRDTPYAVRSVLRNLRNAG